MPINKLCGWDGNLFLLFSLPIPHRPLHHHVSQPTVVSEGFTDCSGSMKARCYCANPATSIGCRLSYTFYMAFTSQQYRSQPLQSSKHHSVTFESRTARPIVERLAYILPKLLTPNTAGAARTEYFVRHLFNVTLNSSLSDAFVNELAAAGEI